MEKKLHYVTLFKPPFPQRGFRYATSFRCPDPDELPASLVMLLRVEAYNNHDAVARALYGQGEVMIGGRVVLEPLAE